MPLGLCEISGSRSGVAGDGKLLGYDAVSVGDTFRRLKKRIFRIWVWRSVYLV